MMAAVAQHSGHDPQTLQDEVEQALLNMAYERLRLSIAWTVGTFVLFILLFWTFFPTDAKYTWIVVILTVSALRHALWHAYQKAGVASRAQRKWHTLFIVSAVAGGLAWAYGLVMLMPDAGRVESMLLVLAALNVSAVAMSSLGPQLVAMLSFQVCILIPTAIALAATGGPVEQLAATVISVGTVALLMIGRASSAATRSLVETDLRLSRSASETSAARERAEAASHAKSRFLANMSHELRSPLNAVIGAAQLLRAGERNPRQQDELIGAIQRSGVNLLGLIDNILDLSRIEAGEMTLSRQDFHLFDCVDAALATAGLAVRAKGLQLACIVDPTLAPWRHGDAGAVRQLLLNLLGNAVKFTHKGDIVVRLQATDMPDEVRITVTDSGVGITPQALAHIFEPFRQGDESAGRRFGGSGLGLAIVRQLTDAMGGHVAVESPPGQGATFALRLPLPRAQHEETEPPAQRSRVAFVEPHQPSAEALHSLLSRMGFDVTRCEDAASLRAWCSGVGPAADDCWLLVCTDADPSKGLVPLALQLLPADKVIGMSGTDPSQATLSADQQVRSRGVTKPVSRSSLASRLVRSTGSADDVTSTWGVSDPDSGLAPHRETHVLVVEDDALNRTIVSRMLAHAGYTVSHAHDGHSALAALREQAFDLVLMDWQMPDMDGLEATRQIRAGAAGEVVRQVPIVALTANAFAEDRDACLQAGMNDFLTKPVLASSLTATVARWARTGGAAAATQPSPGQGAA